MTTLLLALAAGAVWGQQTVTFEAPGASAADLNGRLELRVDGTPVEIESVRAAEDGWHTLVYIDFALTTPGSSSEIAS